MSTNLLILPLVQIAGQTGTNEDWLDGIAFVQDDTNSTPIPLAGITFSMEMRRVTEDATVVLEANSFDGRLVWTENMIHLNITAAQMAGIPPDNYVFDIIGTDPGDAHVVPPHTRIIIMGAFTVFEGVTRL